MTGDVTIDLLLILSFTLLLVVLLLNYFYRLQARHFDLSERALGRVDEIRIVEPATFATLGGDAGAGAGRDAGAQPLHIEGSKVVPVGGASGEFRLVDELPAGAGVEWSVEPAGVATLSVAADTRSVVLYAGAPGTLRLHAVVGSGEAQRSGAFETVASVATRSKELELPWPGRGLGTLVVIIVLLAVVLLLALQGLLDSAAIAALLTAIAGFAFGVRALEAK